MQLEGWPEGTEFRGLDARARRAAEMKRLLDSLLPFARWDRELSPARRDLMIGAYGSTLGAYTTIRAAMENEATDPTPTTYLIRRDGSVVVGWE